MELTRAQRSQLVHNLARYSFPQAVPGLVLDLEADADRAKRES